jgi:hypothetical protein
MNGQNNAALEQETEELIIEEVGAEGEAPQEGAQPTSEGPEDELESYSKNVQKRISRLTEKMRKEERDRQEAERLANQLLAQNRELQGRLQQLDSGYLSEYGARIEAQINAARRAYKEAHEAGDTDRMIEAQEALARAVSDKGRYDLAKNRADRAAPQAQQQLQAQPQQYAQPQPQQPQVDPRARTWAEKNSWFGQDEVMTYAAFGIHRKLVEDEGFDPQSEEYYSEVDRRMRAEFPHKFSGATNSGKSRVAPAGSSASRSTTQGRRVVKLSPSQIAIAKRLGVSLEEYAKYVKD